MSDRPHEDMAVARLAASWLLWYPDTELIDRLDEIAAAVAALPAPLHDPLTAFLGHVEGTPLLDLQAHYVSVFDMKRKACPYLSYWTDGDTRNRGVGILRFQQAYAESGFVPGAQELADHLCVLLEFAAVGDRLTGDALLAEAAASIRLMREAVAGLGSAYVHVLDAVIVTLPRMNRELAARMEQLAAAGPPAEQVGLEPYALTLDTVGGRR